MTTTKSSETKTNTYISIVRDGRTKKMDKKTNKMMETQQQFRTNSMGRALSMIARRQVEPGRSQIALNVSETASPAELPVKGCHKAYIAAL